MNAIGEAREQQGLTQKDLAVKMDVPYIDAPLISKFEHGLVNPIPKDMSILCDALGKPLERVYHPSDLDYGITRNQGNKSTVRLARADTHKLKDTIRCRVPPEMKEELRKCFESDGFLTEQAFTYWLFTVYIKRKTAAPSVKVTG